MNDFLLSLLIIAGVYNFGFMAFHMLFWRLFKWKIELRRISSVNRSIMQVLNLCLTYLFLFMGIISIFFRHDLLNTALGSTILLFFGFFWLIRTIEQIIFFNLKNRLSIFLTVVFLIGAGIYLIPAFLTIT